MSGVTCGGHDVISSAAEIVAAVRKAFFIYPLSLMFIFYSSAYSRLFLDERSEALCPASPVARYEFFAAASGSTSASVFMYSFALSKFSIV